MNHKKQNELQTKFACYVQCWSKSINRKMVCASSLTHTQIYFLLIYLIDEFELVKDNHPSRCQTRVDTAAQIWTVILNKKTLIVFRRQHQNYKATIGFLASLCGAITIFQIKNLLYFLHVQGMRLQFQIKNFVALSFGQK